MKRNTLILTSIICTALWHSAVQGATKYWDIDGTTPGAGGASPAGIWDTDATANWTTDSSGSSGGVKWAFEDDAVFSAGGDAIGAFTVDASSGPTAWNLTTEEGEVTITGSLNVGNSTAGKGIISVASGATNIVSATLSGGDDTGTIRKTGLGSLTLSADNSGRGGTNIIVEGNLAMAVAGALGTQGTMDFGTTPTIVSNGAVLQVSASFTASKPTILNGTGIANSGALRNSVGGGTWSGRAILGSDAKISTDAGGTWTWNASTAVDGTNNGGVLSVTFGGNGGTYRLNNGFRTIILNNAPIYKEGNSVLRFETPTIGVSATYHNGGVIVTRTSGTGNWMTPGTPCYVGAGALGFTTANASPNLTIPMILASGANPLFNVVSATTFTQNSLISGLGGLSVTNVGRLILTAANTYSGNTTILGTAGLGGGTLALSGSGDIASSPVIEVQASGTFDVAAVTAGYVLGASQTLKGNGGVIGNVTANGTISPGASIGTLTFTNDLVVSKVLIEVDKSLTPSNDVVAVIGALSAGAGTLTVTNLNPGMPLEVGDTFQLFKDDLGNPKAVTTGGSLTVVSAEGGVTWNNNLATDGSISVASVSAPQPPPTHARITSISGAGTTSVTVNYTNTIPGTNYTLSYNTNLATPNWYTSGNKIAPGTVDSQTDTPPAGSPRRYYRVYYYRP